VGLVEEDGLASLDTPPFAQSPQRASALVGTPIARRMGHPHFRSDMVFRVGYWVLFLLRETGVASV
jgi:hypothetical protein